MPNTSIVVPCYNEASRLDTAAFLRFSRTAPEVRFLFVDDGSTDRTPEVLVQLSDSRPGQFDVLRLPHNRGKAEAVRQGFLAELQSGSQYVGYWDADLATPLEVIPTFASILDQAPDVALVMGSRVQLLGRRIERRVSRHYLGRVFATAASLALGLRVYDTQCGAKLFRATPEMASLFQSGFRSRWIFDVELLARLVRDCRLRGIPVESMIHEEPLRAWSDVAGSKLRFRHFVAAFVDLTFIFFSRHRRHASTRTVGTDGRVPSYEPVRD